MAAMLVLTSVVTLMAAAPGQAAESEPARGPSITVIGGTSTARYSDEAGSPSQGWWSMAARRSGATSLTVSAEVGSSITVAGNQCQGTKFAQRLRHLRKSDIVIIEVGTSNHKACTSSGQRTLSLSQSRRAIKRYVDQVGARVDALKIPRRRVFFVSPRGPRTGERSATIRSYVKRYASRDHSGFRYIETPRLKTRETIYGDQPNLAGNKVISRYVTRAIARVAQSSRSTPRPTPSGRSMMVIGDSITSMYSNEVGSRSEGWWSMLAGSLGAGSVITSAEGGSGMNVRGNRCTGTTFGERLGQVRRVDILVVEVGRNDYKVCDGPTRVRRNTLESQKAGIDSYVRALSARVTQLGMRADQVWFITPWGTRDEGSGPALQGVIQAAVTAPDIGFHFVQTPILADHLTFDGVHPNRAGNAVLAETLREAVTAPS